MLAYERRWLGRDVAAGLSVAAIALPVAIAYASLAGVPVETGIYAAIFPLLADALFGSSRQLIIGPDAAAAADPHRRRPALTNLHQSIRLPPLTDC